MKAAAPDSSSTHCAMSLKAVRPKDRGRVRAARMNAAVKTAAPANQSLERWLKRHTPSNLILAGKTRRCLVTLVPCEQARMQGSWWQRGKAHRNALAAKLFLFNNMQRSRHF